MENNYPLVTVVAVCYNHEKFLEATLDSIAYQTYANIELVIIDDCSSDHSVELISSWVKNRYDFPITFIAHDKNVGLSKSLNESLSISQGEFWKPIACDDVLMPNYLESLVPMLQNRNAHYSGVFCDAVVIDEEFNIIRKSFLGEGELPNDDQQLEWFISRTFPAPGALLRKKWIDVVGGYNENVIVEDKYMWLRLLEESKFVLVKKQLCMYRKSTTHISMSVWLNQNKGIHVIENINIVKRYINWENKAVALEARKNIWQKIIRLKQLKGFWQSAKIAFEVEFFWYQFLLIFILILLPGYYWKKHFVNCFFDYVKKIKS